MNSTVFSSNASEWGTQTKWHQCVRGDFTRPLPCPSHVHTCRSQASLFWQSCEILAHASCVLYLAIQWCSHGLAGLIVSLLYSAQSTWMWICLSKACISSCLDTFSDGLLYPVTLLSLMFVREFSNVFCDGATSLHSAATVQILLDLVPLVSLLRSGGTLESCSLVGGI